MSAGAALFAMTKLWISDRETVTQIVKDLAM